MTDKNKNLLHYVNSISKDEYEFLKNMKYIFTIKNICSLLLINRNRYNYLVRHNQLDNELLKLREVAK